MHLSILLGDHELNLKTVEKQSMPRTFNVELNGVRVLREIDIQTMAGGVGRALNIYVTYRVSADKKTLSLRGYPDSVIEMEQIALDFCYGECVDPGININFIMSAFSVLQLTEIGDEEGQSGEKASDTGKAGDEGKAGEKGGAEEEEEEEEEESTTAAPVAKKPATTTKKPIVTTKKPPLQPVATTAKPPSPPVTPKKKVKVKTLKAFDVPDDRRR